MARKMIFVLINFLLLVNAGYGKAAEFYIGFFKGVWEFNPNLVLLTTEASVDYFVEAPGIGYYVNGTILANRRVIVNLSYSIVVESYNDQNNGIYLSTSSDKVTVIGQSTDGRIFDRITSYRNSRKLKRMVARNLDTFIVNEITDLCISKYEYFAVSVNGFNHYHNNSSVLIVGTRNNTLVNLTVTQPITTNVGNGKVTSLIPGREYLFVINRLQTVYLSSSIDLTGTRIITNKPVSVFSGHSHAKIFNSTRYGHIIEQMPPTAVWGNIYYVMPLDNHHRTRYALKILAANECVIDIHCVNSTNFSTLRMAGNVHEMFLNNETCTVWSFSKVLVVQFSLGYQGSSGHGPMMTLVPPLIHYHNKIIFSTFWKAIDSLWIHYINVIVPAEYYQPDRIYLVNEGIMKSLGTQEWMPIKFDNITKAYGTKINNISSKGMNKIIHTNQAAVLSVIVYGFTRIGGYGTTANAFSSEIVSPPDILTNPSSSTVVFYDNAQFRCVARSCELMDIVWKKAGSQRLPLTAVVTNIPSNVNEIISVLKITEAIGYYSGQYYCEVKNSAGTVISSLATLYVKVKYPEIIRLPENTTVLPHGVAIFSCLATSQSGLIYDWKILNKTSLPYLASSSYDRWQFSTLEGHFTTVSRLTISDVQPSNEGWYCCLATNERGTVKECAWLEVNTKPVITAQPTSSRLRVGSENTPLRVSANGTGPIYYHWEKYQPLNDSWIDLAHRVVNISSSELKFKKVSEEDEGIYHCVITSDDGSVISDNATIIVYGPPIINFISTNMVVSEREEVKLSCIATNDKDAEDPLHIHWINPSGVTFKSNQTNLFIYNESNSALGQLQLVLSFYSANRSDGGEYTCQAFNHIKSRTELKTNLTVQYPPVVTIYPLQSPHRVSVGTRLLLSCEAHAQPTPMVQWYRGTTMMNYVSQQFHQSYKVPTTVPHSAVYTCVVTNSFENTTHTVRKSIKVIVQKLCSPLSFLKNGRIYFIDNKQTALFVCNSGYTIIGNPHVSCVDGTWNSSSPVCNL